jgi:hypothetical protein
MVLWNFCKLLSNCTASHSRSLQADSVTCLSTNVPPCSVTRNCTLLLRYFPYWVISLLANLCLSVHSVLYCTVLILVMGRVIQTLASCLQEKAWTPDIRMALPETRWRDPHEQLSTNSFILPFFLVSPFPCWSFQTPIKGCGEAIWTSGSHFGSTKFESWLGRFVGCRILLRKAVWLGKLTDCTEERVVTILGIVLLLWRWNQQVPPKHR